MKINIVLENLRKYLLSVYYPTTLGLFAFLTWLMPGNWVYFTASIYALLSFLPLFAKEGKCYLPLYLFQIVLPNSPLLLNGIPGEVMLTGISTIVSSIVFLILNKPKLIRGDFFYPLLILGCTLLFSYLYNMVRDGNNDFKGILYLLAFFGLLLLTIFFSTILERKEILPYFSSSVAIFSVIITTEIISVLFYENSATPLVWNTFYLGWAMSGSTASTLLALSLPFLSMNIAKKRYQDIPVFLYNATGILLISSYSGLVALLFSLIPLIFLTFSNYGNKYPYLVLFFLVFTGTILSLLIGFNKTANTNILNALRALNPNSNLPQGRLDSYQLAIKQIKQNPFLGISIAGRTLEDGSISFTGNNILTTMTLGGSLSLIAYLGFDIYTYFLCLRKKTSERFLFLVFLLLLELIGYMDDTIFLLPILFFVLIAIVVYQMSDRPQDAIIHQEFFENNPTENLLDKR